jgi:NADH-quinone oxidoreductase E subunit
MGIDLKPVEFTQPESFEFIQVNKAKARKIIARYPAGREQSAVMPLLMLAQQQNDGWLPQAAIDYVASILGMAPIKVKEVASFYTMYNLQPVGQYHIQVCGTTPCMLRGSQAIVDACKAKLGIDIGETTPDGKFTLTEVECLGACVNAPVMEVTTPEKDGYFEDLTPHLAQELIDLMAGDAMPDFGSQTGRAASSPETGSTTLILDPVKTVQEVKKKAAPKKKAPAKKPAAKKAPAKKAPAKKTTAVKTKSKPTKKTDN